MLTWWLPGCNVDSHKTEIETVNTYTQVTHRKHATQVVSLWSALSFSNTVR